MKIKILSSLSLATAFIFAAIPLQSNAGVKFDSPTYGYELGVERQLETAFGRDVVERTYGRALGTAEWQLYNNQRGDTFDFQIKGGAYVGKYKGSKFVEDEFGSVVQTRAGVTSEAQGVYTLNTGKVSPLIGVSGVLESTLTHNARIEWQADAIAGVKFDISTNNDLSLIYKKTLVHGFDYTSQGKQYNQDDGYLVALVGTRRMADNTTRSVKLAYERFEVGDFRQESNGGVSYEPDTENILVSYSRTF